MLLVCFPLLFGDKHFPGLHPAGLFFLFFFPLLEAIENVPETVGLLLAHLLECVPRLLFCLLV